MSPKKKSKVRGAKKNSEVMKAARALLARMEGGDYMATGPDNVVAAMWKIIHLQCLNRELDGRDIADIKELNALGWDVPTIACGLELTRAKVTACLAELSKKSLDQ
jgi:hypothetical protein